MLAESSIVQIAAYSDAVEQGCPRPGWYGTVVLITLNTEKGASKQT